MADSYSIDDNVAASWSREKGPSDATITSVNDSAATAQLLAANANRRGAIIMNESTAILYLAFAATASLTAYTVQVAANTSYTLPQPAYTGVISGIWASDTAPGAARITELV